MPTENGEKNGHEENHAADVPPNGHKSPSPETQEDIKENNGANDLTDDKEEETAQD